MALPYTDLLPAAVEQIANCADSRGGYGPRPNLPARSDATAWAALVLAAGAKSQQSVDAACSWLAANQLEDGRVPIAPDHPASFWPTTLAILAWARTSTHQTSQARAVQFLLKTTGRHWKKDRDTPFAHDPALRGWPWIDETHSWIEPTALAILALSTAGNEHHPRVQEAVRMLLDRQLPQGGWNYGNTKVFGRELFPMPENTGVALHALGGRVPEQRIARSLEYLTAQIHRLRTPIALGWSLLGLQAWKSLPSGAEDLVAACLARQDRYGGYDLSSLCLLLLPMLSPSGLLPRGVAYAATE